MPTLLTIKRRISSVTSTKQITKAMQMVAASKLRKAEQATHGPRSFIEHAQSAVHEIARDNGSHPLIKPRPVTHGLTIIVAGDHGMAGAYNGNVMKAMVQSVEGIGVPNAIICIGHRIASLVDHYEFANLHAVYDADTPQTVSALAHPVATEAMHLYEDGSVDRIDLVFTAYTSTAKQEVVTRRLLPLELPEASGPTDPLVVSESPSALPAAAQRLIEASILEGILNARASEQAARMVSMMNATNNAKDLIEDLTLSYHEARQSAITQELAEISTGAEALQSANGGGYG